MVKNWITLNEIRCFTWLAYGVGNKAPGRKEDDALVNQTIHHALLCHGHGVQAVREFGGAGAVVGLTDNCDVSVPVTDNSLNRFLYSLPDAVVTTGDCISRALSASLNLGPAKLWQPSLRQPVVSKRHQIWLPVKLWRKPLKSRQTIFPVFHRNYRNELTWT